MNMKTVGVFELGQVPDALAAAHGNYVELIVEWLRPALPECEYRPLRLVRDGLLPPVEACDAYVYSGSRHGVYDALPWMAPLAAFVREAAARGRPQFGICFGHQLIAQAMGGRAGPFTGGWNCGVQAYTLAMDGGEVELPVYVMHQDQVLERPPQAQVIGRSGHCAIGALEYDAAPIRSVQFHPEFNRGYVADLLRLRATSTIPAALATAAGRSLATRVDNAVIARWAAGFLRAHLARVDD